MDAPRPSPLRVVRAAQVPEPSAEQPPWLVEPLWTSGAVGLIGGAPKSGKTWLALELAVAVGSGCRCLGRFAVGRPGPVLVFAAEDAPHHLKHRIGGLAAVRGAAFADLDVHLIIENSLRLDRQADLDRLRLTVAAHRPSLLILDPFVRLQRADENDARQVATILSELRDLSRAARTAVALVHHVRKNGAAMPGQALRGSGDFWAWGDSNLYLARSRTGLELTVEHRAAPAPPPIPLMLAASEHHADSRAAGAHLQVRPDPVAPREPPPLVDRILAVLHHDRPTPHRTLRAALRVRDQTLSDALRALEAAGRLARTAHGWRLASPA